MLTIDAIGRLRNFLRAVESSEGFPRFDVEWLRTRCDDTLSYAGQRQQDSIRQLSKDIAEFMREFPNLLPVDLAREFGLPER